MTSAAIGWTPGNFRDATMYRSRRTATVGSTVGLGIAGPAAPFGTAAVPLPLVAAGAGVAPGFEGPSLVGSDITSSCDL
jgi:hypothetical protein